jgi:hypothetical protein
MNAATSAYIAVAAMLAGEFVMSDSDTALRFQKPGCIFSPRDTPCIDPA